MSQLSIKLNQQCQTKGSTAQDYSFLKEAPPIYVTSLTGNHVTGTTTITTGTASNITNNCVTGSNVSGLPLQQPLQILQNNNQQTSTLTTTSTGNSGTQSHHYPPSSVNKTPLIIPSTPITSTTYNNKSLTPYQSALVNHLHDSGSVKTNQSIVNHQLTASLTNNQQFVNLTNNNNSNNSNFGAGSKYYGNSNSEVIANGHGPKRELSTLSEGDFEPTEEQYEPNSISKSNNTLLTSGGTEVLLGDQNLRQDSRPRRRSGSSIVVLGTEETIKSRLATDDYMGQSGYQSQGESKGVDLEMLTMLSVNQDNGPHREMAVDVPESFIARNKTPPRYPPPRIPTQVNQIPNGEAMPQIMKTQICVNTTVGGGVNLELKALDSFGNHYSKRSLSLDSNSHEFSKKSSLKAPSSLGGSTCDSLGFDSMSYRTKSRGSLSTRSSSSGDFGPPEYDQGPHRELPVDVPDSFVQTKKAPPRYPPPKPQIINEVAKNKNSLSSHGSWEENSTQQQLPVRNNELNGSVRPVPPPRDHLRIEKDGRLVNRAPAPQVPDRKISNLQQNIAQIVEPTLEQLDSIKKYQEQLRRRQEEQDRIVQQNEFLRNSLRGSRKLQALQDSPLQERPAIGIENDAYAEDENLDIINGYGELLAALQRLQNELSKQGLAALASRVTAAQQMLSGPNIARALAIRAAVLQRRRPHVHNPVCSNAQTLAKDCVECLSQSSSSAAIELCDLLSTYEMEGLLLAHDRIASTTDRSPATVLFSSPNDNYSNKIQNQNANIINNNVLEQREPLNPPLGVIRDTRDPIRIIQIEKSSEPLGATILNEGDAVVIGRIVRGGAAEKSGLLHEKDEILEVNGIEMSGKSVNDVCALLSAMSGTLTFLIVPAGSPPPGGGREPPVLHVRAHFDYDPEDDMYIPCRELGISFQKGDVLHVISRDDPNWWQAYREGEEDQTLAGLIPSQSFQHQRESMKLAIAGEAGLTGVGRHKNSGKGSTLLCVKKSDKSRKKKGKASSEAGYPLYATTTPDDPDPEEILTYEEVALYYPRASHKRPIVLIGPPNIGRHELRQRLMADSDRFAAAVPHTSRQRRDGEVPGQDYHFISRLQFEADILSRKFVEHGEYERAYYGTSLEAIRTVVSSGKICVLNLHPQSLKLLRASDLKPYVVLVAPPSLEKLRQKKIRNGEPVKDDDLKEIIATARDMEARWGHLFDMIIINNDTERAYHQLLAEINSLEREPQWVPASWVHN